MSKRAISQYFEDIDIDVHLRSLNEGFINSLTDTEIKIFIDCMYRFLKGYIYTRTFYMIEKVEKQIKNGG